MSSSGKAHSKAETALVSALKRGRSVGLGKTNRGEVTFVGDDSMAFEDTRGSIDEAGGMGETKMVPPRPPVLTAAQEDVAMVKVLNVTKFDSTRQFPGLAKQKIEKKDRHMKAVDDFTKLLDTVAEKIEQEVLTFSRSMRENLEKVDESLQESYGHLQNSNFLIPKSEDDLKDMLGELKTTVAGRLQVIETFGNELDSLEKRRADTISTELKALVDRLIAIAHQLPDEIEHIVEQQIFDLNNVLTINRKAHSSLLGMLRKRQVEVDIETLQRWEDGRVYWRNLRHKKALGDFDVDIKSDRFEKPRDRSEYVIREYGLYLEL